MAMKYRIEVTHHGPSFNVPTMFVELGSSESQWRDSKAGEAVAHSTMYAIVNFSKPVGFGSYRHWRNALQSKIYDYGFGQEEAIFGHMIPKYAVCNLDSEMLSQCRTRTFEKVSLAVLDWKGIKSEDKPKLFSTLQDVGMPGPKKFSPAYKKL